jgi:DNA-directed RNA polymerase subunit RPC12/RpoP
MFNENRFINFEIFPQGPRKRKGKFEVYRPKDYEKTPSGKMEKIEREISQKEAQKVLENLNEIGEIKCLKCNSRLIDENDEDPKFYKYRCLDCGFKWQWEKKEVEKKFNNHGKK